MCMYSVNRLIAGVSFLFPLNSVVVLSNTKIRCLWQQYQTDGRIHVVPRSICTM